MFINVFLSDGVKFGFAGSSISFGVGIPTELGS